jgi:NhaC family Na+:H+ antiporter
MEDSGFLRDIIRGGGVISMLNVAFIVLISSAYSGIFEGTNMLKEIQNFLETIAEKYGIFAASIFTGIITAALGCTQAIAILLTNQLIGNVYEREGRDKYELAQDLENTAVVLAPLVPWNIGGAVPAATLTATIGFLPYAFYLYLIPLYGLVMDSVKRSHRYTGKKVA